MISDLLPVLPDWAIFLFAAAALYGGYRLGMTLAGLMRSFTLKTLLKHAHDLFVGLAIGCLPLIFGYFLYPLPYFAGLVIVFLLALVVPLFAYDQIEEMLHSKALTHIAAGGGLGFLGLVVLVNNLRHGQSLLSADVISTAVFMVASFSAFVQGLRDVLTATPAADVDDDS